MKHAPARTRFDRKLRIRCAAKAHKSQLRDTVKSQFNGNASQKTVYWFDRRVKAPGLINLMWKSATRHAGASRWVMAGIPIAVVSKFLGHGSIQMTMRHAHPMPKHNNLAVSATMSSYN